MRELLSETDNKYNSDGKKVINRIDKSETQHLEKDTVKDDMPIFRLSSSIFVYGNTHMLHSPQPPSQTYTNTQCFFTPFLNKVKMQQKIISEIS